MKSSSLRFFPLALVLIAGAFASCSAPAAAVKGCDDPRPLLVDDQETGLDVCTGGLVHRSKIVTCSISEPPAGKCQIDPENPGSCATNADCAEDQRLMACAPPTLQQACSCAPTCTTDADCGPGRMCRCDGIVPFCQKALCANDAACPEGRMCILTDFVSCEGGHVQGFACQSDLDECLTSLDCPDQLRCAYDGDHRTCVKTFCAQ